jgi:hypothetical protein
MALRESDEERSFREVLGKVFDLDSNGPFIGNIMHLRNLSGIPLKMETLMRFLSQICAANCGTEWKTWLDRFPPFSTNRVVDAAKKWVQHNCPEKEDKVLKPEASKVVVADCKLNATQVVFVEFKQKTQWTQGGYGRRRNMPA